MAGLCGVYREVAAIQVFLYSINAISVSTTVSVSYRAGVHNSGVSIRRGSTVFLIPNVGLDHLTFHIM